jgi:hypothetical protein
MPLDPFQGAERLLSYPWRTHGALMAHSRKRNGGYSQQTTTIRSAYHIDFLVVACCGVLFA